MPTMALHEGVDSYGHWARAAFSNASFSASACVDCDWPWRGICVNRLAKYAHSAKIS